VSADHVCRVIDAFVEMLVMSELGFERAQAAETGRPGYDPRDLLKLYLYGYLNQIRSSRAAKKAGESRGQHEVIYIVALHEEFLSSVGHRALCLGILITTCCRWLGGVQSDFNECPYLAACLKLRDADGYSLSSLSQKGIVVAPRIAPWCGS
jgi:Transposase domain (DUF772)